MRLYPFLLVFSVFLVDQITKILVTREIVFGSEVRVLPFLSLIFVKNFGGLFGLMNRPSSNTVFTVFPAAVCLFLTFLLLRAGSRAIRLSLSFVLGGALGNIWDRLTRGFVVDFLDLHASSFHWPAFNVADLSITLGVCLLCYFSFIRGEGWMKN